MFHRLLVIGLLFIVFIFLPTMNSQLLTIRADEISDLQRQIDELNKARQQSISATKPLEGQLDALKRQLAQIQAKLNDLALNIKTKEKELLLREDKIAAQQALLEVRIRSYYIRSYSASPLLVILSSSSPGDLFRELTISQNQSVKDRQFIVSLTAEIKDLLTQKEKLEKDKVSMASLQAQVDKNADFIGGEVGKAKKYQAELSSKIAQLSAQQQQLVSRRLSSLNIPRSAGTSTRGCSDDRNIDPGFSPRIAFFTYGAPHRNGLNQYGAFGRAKLGQNEEEILSAYYPNMSLKRDYDQNSQINVDGNGTFSIEDYVKRIWEVPNSWGDEGGMSALKAQAVAARTYALNSMQRNGHICTTEACQVFRPEVKGGNWEQAVELTKGWVLMDGGNPGFTQYASTHGGYIQNLSKFDGTTGNPSNFSELNERAYDKQSPWFYCDWGSRGQGNTAWLKSQEVADIINVILLARVDLGTKDHFYQTDKPHPYGGEIWNEDRVKTELRSRNITPYNNISEILVSADFSSGKTTSVNVSGEGGSQSFSGTEFKDWFNLRAPANIQIVGPLYNVERK